MGSSDAKTSHRPQVPNAAIRQANQMTSPRSAINVDSRLRCFTPPTHSRGLFGSSKYLLLRAVSPSTNAGICIRHLHVFTSSQQLLSSLHTSDLSGPSSSPGRIGRAYLRTFHIACSLFPFSHICWLSLQSSYKQSCLPQAQAMLFLKRYLMG